MLKRRLIVALWWLLAITVTGLLVAAVQQKNELLCNDIKVDIEGNEGHVFMDEKEIADKLKANGAAAGKKMRDMDLRTMESIINKQPWIQNAELYFDNNQVLQVRVKEREPIARVFTLEGSSFYIDSSGMRLPLSKDYSAHVPIFTSFTSNKKVLSKLDSVLLNDVKNMARYIQQDSFWTAQVSQVVITPQSKFEIIPVVGNQTLLLGSADSLESKFSRLFAWYKQVWAKHGFEKYETVSVEFDGQIVATRRGEPKPTIDSAFAQRIVMAMRSGVDLLKDSSLSYHPVDETQNFVEDTLTNTFVPAPVDTTRSNQKPVATKEETTKNILGKRDKKTIADKAKAVMPKTRKRA